MPMLYDDIIAALRQLDLSQTDHQDVDPEPAIAVEKAA